MKERQTEEGVDDSPLVVLISGALLIVLIAAVVVAAAAALPWVLEIQKWSARKAKAVFLEQTERVDRFCWYENGRFTCEP